MTKPIALIGIHKDIDNFDLRDRVAKEIESEYFVLFWRSPVKKPQLEVHNCPADQETIDALQVRLDELCKVPLKVKS